MAEALLHAIAKIGIVLGDEVVNAVIAELSAKVTNLVDLPENVKFIRRELGMMNSVIQDLDTTNLRINVVKQWISELRNLSFHVEDVMDKYSYHAFQLREEESLKKLYRGAYYTKVFSEVADELVHIKREIEQVKNLRTDYFHPDLLGPRSPVATGQQVYQGCLPEHVEDDDLVGINANRAEMIRWIGSNERDSKVITVSGMGGLGKTTLVSNVYNREKIKFPVYAWITVSKTYRMDALLGELLRKIGCTENASSASINRMDLRELRDEIRLKLEGSRKCIVVLDDVWDRDVFLKMEDIFKGLGASCVIITTRNNDVASLASPGYHLQLQPLDYTEAFDLFCRRAFRNRLDHECPLELKEVATSIVNKCKGLPLAIISMGSLMSSKRPIEHAWNQVDNQFKSELIKPGDVQAILNLSYNELPGNIRNCLLYCSLFPEDYTMSRESLVRQWVAEGFAVTNQNNTPEDVAELNLMELITRNLLQVVDYDELGRVSTCKMHDILRDLAVAAAEQERFGSANDQGEMIQIDKEVRRLSSCGWNDNSDTPAVAFPRLRTLLSLDGVTPTHYMLTSIMHGSSYLTVLELQDSEITQVPDCIGKMFNLRYLGLRRTGVNSLPESVGKLSNLQTLDAKQTQIEKLPRGIVHMKKLRHLLADKVMDEKKEGFQYFIGVQPPKDLSKLVELQTLETVQASDGLAAQLEKLRKLQSVWIDNVSAMHSEQLFATLSKMPLLSCLLLNASDENQALHLKALNPESKKLHKLIIWGRWAAGTLKCSIFHSHGINLKYLAISWSGLGEDHGS